MSAPVRRNPVPSLLTSLLADHLDPGYAAAARTRHGRRHHQRRWQAVGAGLVGVVLGVAAVTASERAPVADQVRDGLLAEVGGAQQVGAELDAQRAALAAEADTARARALTGDAEGRAALATLDELDALAAATAVIGPGVVVTVSDSAAEAPADEVDPTAVQQGTVLDRDLQLVVNALWAAGAEAVSVGGVRLAPGTTVRQAGGAMLVDDRPVPSPYLVEAVGDPDRLQTGFVVSDAYLRLSAVAQVYGIGFDVRAEDELSLAAAESAELRLAVPAGPA